MVPVIPAWFHCTVRLQDSWGCEGINSRKQPGGDTETVGDGGGRGGVIYDRIGKGGKGVVDGRIYDRIGKGGVEGRDLCCQRSRRAYFGLVLVP